VCVGTLGSGRRTRLCVWVRHANSQDATSGPSLDPSKQPPCSKMSPLTSIGIPSAFDSGVAVSMQRRMGETIRRLIWSSGFSAGCSATIIAARHSACAKPVSVRVGSEDRPGLVSDGTSGARVGSLAFFVRP